MSDTNKPWENDTGPAATPPAPPPPPAAPEDLAALKAKADELGVQYAANIGAETLSTRIAEAQAAQAGANDDAGKPEPTVVTPAPDINAQKVDEKVSRKERQSGATNVDDQAPLEIINMVSGGMSLKEARRKHEAVLTRRAKRAGDAEDEA